MIFNLNIVQLCIIVLQEILLYLKILDLKIIKWQSLLLSSPTTIKPGINHKKTYRFFVKHFKY